MRQRGEHITKKSPGVVMGHALSHPLRVRILMSMNAPVRTLSPKEFSDESAVSLGSSSYHFRILRKAGCIEISDEVPKRGATEHRYLPVKRAMAWTREWENLGSVVKQNLAASALRGAVELIGEAVDEGTFEALPDSILAWDAMWVDQEGWDKSKAIVERALTELIAVSDECRDRIADLPPEKVFLNSYVMATFESPRSEESLRAAGLPIGRRRAQST
jgi:hypothetical protein